MALFDFVFGRQEAVADPKKSVRKKYGKAVKKEAIKQQEANTALATPPAPPTPDMPEVADAMRIEQEKERQKGRSRAATILTSPTGLMEEPSLSRRILMGA